MMEGISNTKPFVPKPRDYSFIKDAPRVELTRLNCTAEEAGLDVDKYIAMPYEEWKREWEERSEAQFREFYMHQNEGMYADYKRIQAECKATINDYFDGNLSDEELGEMFQKHLVNYLEACDNNDYPTPLGIGGEIKYAAKVFYSEFRRELLAAAVQRNNEEGRQYIVGNRDEPLDAWKYYNSDYYYKSESGIAALTDSVMNFAEAMELEDFKLKDYKAEGLYLYYNFNSALANPFQLDQKIFDDWDTVPPKDFQWFSQSGRSTEMSVTLHGWIVDGVLQPLEPTPKEDLSFDPTNPRRGTTWAAYLDENGERHFVSQDIVFDYTEKDLFKVSKFLQFGGDSPRVNEVNRFLDNLKVYSHNYYLRYPMTGFSVNA